jgi:uncharacterized protein with GYD domain
MKTRLYAINDLLWRIRIQCFLNQEGIMPAYIVLINFTEQGARTAKDTVKRLRETEKAMQAAGGRKIGAWWTLGPYDMVLVAEGPDDETTTRLLLASGMQGNVRTMTMRAFSEEEMEKIVQGLP